MSNFSFGPGEGPTFRRPDGLTLQPAAVTALPFGISAASARAPDLTSLAAQPPTGSTDLSVS